jgi:hypothetical protein
MEVAKIWLGCVMGSEDAWNALRMLVDGLLGSGVMEIEMRALNLKVASSDFCCLVLLEVTPFHLHFGFWTHLHHSL